MDEKWLTVEELATKYDVTARTIYNWVRELGLPRVYLGKKLYSFESGNLFPGV